MFRQSRKKLAVFAIVFLQCILVYLFWGRVTEIKALSTWSIPEKVVRHRLFTSIHGNRFISTNQPEVERKDCSFCHFGNGGSTRNTSSFFEFFTDKYSLNDSVLTASYIDHSKIKSSCDGKVVIFNDLFGILHDVILHPERIHDITTLSKGGEDVRDVLYQTLDKEDYQFNSDFFVIDCQANSTVHKLQSRMKWVENLKLESTVRRQNENVRKGSDRYIVAIRREDYANLHNWVRNIYNTFLIMMHFKLQPVNVSIMFMDGHPFTELDNAWRVIYGEPQRVGRLDTPIKYHNLVLGFKESEGPVSKYENKLVPFLEEFRDFVLARFELNSEVLLDCKQLKITVIFRRNAVYHPRNVEGNVGRKIFNEAEVTNALMKAYPHACVKALLMETLPMKAQLDVIRQTDILIGMHGAGMSHTIFLPKHAGILELFSRDFKNGRPWYRCYQSIASWRNLSYETWENFDSSLEMPFDFTIVPVYTILVKTQALVNKLCPRL